MIYLAIWIMCVTGMPDHVIPLPSMAACEAVAIEVVKFDITLAPRCLPPGAPALSGEADETCYGGGY